MLKKVKPTRRSSSTSSISTSATPTPGGTVCLSPAAEPGFITWVKKRFRFRSKGSYSVYQQELGRAACYIARSESEIYDDNSSSSLADPKRTRITARSESLPRVQQEDSSSRGDVEAPRDENPQSDGANLPPNPRASGGLTEAVPPPGSRTSILDEDVIKNDFLTPDESAIDLDCELSVFNEPDYASLDEIMSGSCTPGGDRPPFGSSGEGRVPVGVVGEPDALGRGGGDNECLALGNPAGACYCDGPTAKVTVATSQDCRRSPGGSDSGSVGNPPPAAAAGSESAASDRFKDGDDDFRADLHRYSDLYANSKVLIRKKSVMTGKDASTEDSSGGKSGSCSEGRGLGGSEAVPPLPARKYKESYLRISGLEQINLTDDKSRVQRHPLESVENEVTCIFLPEDLSNIRLENPEIAEELGASKDAVPVFGPTLRGGRAEGSFEEVSTDGKKPRCDGAMDEEVNPYCESLETVTLREFPEGVCEESVAAGSGSSIAHLNSGSDEPPPLPVKKKSNYSSSPCNSGDLRYDFIKNMDQLKNCGWYWGPLTYQEAKAKLDAKPDGSFLVRDSSDDRYILSLSFKSNGHVYHTRIEHHKGMFSFSSQPESHQKSMIKEFVEQAMQNSENGRFLYFLQASSPGTPPIPIRLLHPVSRFSTIFSLQHLCRFTTLRLVRRDHIDLLPIPQRLKDYLWETQYYVEGLE